MRVSGGITTVSASGSSRCKSTAQRTRKRELRIDDRVDQRTHLMRRGRVMTEAVPMLTRNRHSPAH
jgi:hypothetical protein